MAKLGLTISWMLVSRLLGISISPEWGNHADVRVGIDETRNPVLHDVLAIAYVGCPDIYVKVLDHFLNSKDGER